MLFNDEAFAQIPGQLAFVASPPRYTTTMDLLGPRYSWDFDISEEDERMSLDLYGGDWTINYESMGEDCCWHSPPARIVGVGRAIELALGALPIGSLDDIVSAHLHWARIMGGAKAAGMRRSLDVQLAKHGRRIAL